MPMPSPQLLTLRVRSGVLRIEVVDNRETPKTALVVSCASERERAPRGVLVLNFATRTASRPVEATRRFVEDQLPIDDVAKRVVRDGMSKTIATVKWLQSTETA
jgi:hypothetical protein